MTKTGARIKKYRERMQLSCEYVANYLGITTEQYCTLEGIDDLTGGTAETKLSYNTARKLAKLYGVHTDTLIYGNRSLKNMKKEVSDIFESLDEEDQQEILLLVRWKRDFKANRNNHGAYNNKGLIQIEQDLFM